jgi:hypothetical protein
MCVLIKDLRRSGVHVCANKGLRCSRCRQGAFRCSSAALKRSEEFLGDFSAVAFSASQKLHYNALSSKSVIPTCIIMQFFVTFRPILSPFLNAADVTHRTRCSVCCHCWRLFTRCLILHSRQATKWARVFCSRLDDGAMSERSERRVQCNGSWTT